MRNWHGLRVVVLMAGILCLCQFSHAALKNQNTLNLKDEGVSQGDVKSINCVGNDIACTASSGSGTFTLSSSSSSGWTDNGTQVNLTTSSDSVGIGNADQGKLSITNSTNIDALFIKGHTLQTDGKLLHIISSDGSERANISGDGTWAIVGNGTTPILTVNTEVYDATGWNGDLSVPTKDALRDKIETITTSPWQTTSNVTNQVTATDNVTVGSSTNLGKLAVDGDTDEIQLLVQANGTQNADIFVAENSAGTNLLTLSADGGFSVTGTGTDALIIGGGSQPTIETTFNVSGTDTKLVATSGNVSFSHDITVSGDDIAMLTNTKGGILVADGTNFSPLTVGANGTILSADSSAANGVKWAEPTPITTKGDLMTWISSPTRLPVGANGTVLSADSSTSTGLRWATPPTGGGSGDMILASVQTNTGVKTFNTGTLKFPDLAYIADANGNEIVSLDTVTTATNYIVIANSATGGRPVISADGSDTNISLGLNSKGTGGVTITQGSATAQQSTISAGLVVNNSQNTSATGGFAVLSSDGSRVISADSTGGFSTTGKFISSNVNDLGWSFVDGTDNTTGNSMCLSACVFGIANASGTAVTNLVSCSDATADSAICAGNN